MTTRANGPLSGFEWLKRGLNSGRNNPRAIFGGAAILMTAALLPGVLQAILQAVFRPEEQGAVLIAALTTLVSVALTAPLMGGYLRVIHASEQGLPARAADILAPFRDRQDARQLMTFALVVLLIQLLVAAVLGGLFREVLVDLQQWMERVMTLSQEARTQQGKAPPMPPLPEGTGGFLGLGSLLVLFIGGVFAVGLGQLTLARRGVRGALADGLAGTAKNLLPLLVLAILAFCMIVAATLALGLVGVVVAMVASLLHPALTTLVLLPMFMLFYLVLYVVLFGVVYHLWRDVAGDAPLPVGGIEL